MRLKAFTGATLAEAMQQVRDALGDGAPIMLTEETDAGVRVVASYDPDEPAAAAAAVASPPSSPSPPRKKPDWLIADPEARSAPGGEQRAQDSRAGHSAAIADTLAYHGAPELILNRLSSGATGASPAATLAVRLGAVFRFAGLADAVAGKPLLLAGPPGAGKTLAAAKLAARGVIAGFAVRLISTDAASAGAIEQLSAFIRPLGIEVESVDGPVGLATLLTSTPAAPQSLVIIDTQGVNPFDRTELADLGAQIVTIRADPLLVLPAGGDARETAEMAEAFARVGCSRLLATRLDVARRLGGLLAAANTGFAFSEISASPIVADGFQPLNPNALARLLIDNSRKRDMSAP
jgi:flagellar biosynthesis protein FlhF